MKVFVVCLIALVLVPQSAFALGIGPARVEMDFQPGLSEDLSVTVYSNEPYEQGIEMYVSGDLKDYVTLSRTTARIPPQGSVEIPFSITLPQTAPKEGRLDTRIGAVQAEARGEGNTLAKVAVEAQLWVLAPVPGKALEASLDVQDVRSGEDVNFILELENVGSEQVEAQPEIMVSKEGSQIGSLQLDTVTIQSLERKTLEKPFPTSGLQEGEYQALASISYDGQTAFASDNFSIGGFTVRISGIEFSDIEKGGKGHFDVKIDSLFSGPIEDVFIEAEVFRNGKVGSFSSGKISLAGRESRTVPMLWDASALDSGEYQVVFTLHYGGKTDAKEVTAKIVEGFGIFYLVNAVLIIVLIAFIILYRRGRKKNRKK